MEAVELAKIEAEKARPMLKGEFSISDTKTVSIRPGMMTGAGLALAIAMLRSSHEKSFNKTARETLLELNYLVVSSRSDPAAFDQISTAARVCIEQRIRMPAVLRRWVCKLLNGEAVRPSTPSSQRRAKAYPQLYDIFIARIVSRIRDDFRVPIISENSPNWSACDVVAKALLDLEMKPTSALEVYRIFNKVGGKSFPLHPLHEDYTPAERVDDPFAE